MSLTHKYLTFKGDYEMVVNDYSKAKSLVSDNAPLVFKKGNKTHS